VETAITEALFLASLERNGDIVCMTSYAPLLAKEGFTSWNPDLIYFNNTEVKPTVGYYTQKLYGQNSGQEYIASYVDVSHSDLAVKNRFGVSIVKDTVNNELIVKIINLLHASVEPELLLENYEFSNDSVIKTILSGKPFSRTEKPVESVVGVEDTFNQEIPPFSFTVLRYKL